MPSERDKVSENPYESSSVEDPRGIPPTGIPKVRTVATTIGLVVAIAPLIVATDISLWGDMDSSGNVSIGPRAYRYYYFWFFGYVAKLPYEHELPYS